MRLTIKNWPYPKGVKAMLLRIGNPIYDGQGDWHSNVTFRSIYKEYQTVPLAWGWLPMLKTGLVFCNGSPIDHIRNETQKNFEFMNARFEFFIHEFTSDNVLVKLPCFRTTQDGITYNIAAIEIVRSFFARTRTLAYEILQENSLIRLCQSRLNEGNEKSVTIQFAPECPGRLCSETWLPVLAWLSTNELAELSWTSFFYYYKICQNATNELGLKPLFPLYGDFSLDCYWRCYGKNVWFDEISNIHCDALDFDEILASKYVVEKKYDSGNKHGTSSFISTSQSGNMGIVDTKPASIGGSVTLKTDLPGFIFKKQPKIHITEKILEIGKYHAWGDGEEKDEIEITGKNIGFINCGKGVEFAEIENKDLTEIEQLDILVSLGLKEAFEKDLTYNTTIPSYLEEIKVLSKMPGIVKIKNKLYELPNIGSFAWIAPGIKRCCVISFFKMNSTTINCIIEADRLIYGSSQKWSVATLFVNISLVDFSKTLYNLIMFLTETGHWGEEGLQRILDNAEYKRIKHGGNLNRMTKIWDALVQKDNYRK